MRNLALAAAEGIPGTQFLGEPTIDIVILGDTYGGPWDDIVLDQHSTLSLTESMARVLNAREGDRFIQVTGDSMAAAGILDGSYVLMSYLKPPVKPRKYDIALVQIEAGDGTRRSTIKRWMGLDAQGIPVLHDGDDEPVTIPEDTVSITPVMVARGAITAF